MTRTPARLLAGATAAVIALSGCGSAVRTGAAATVGKDRISDTALQQVVERGSAAAKTAGQTGADKAALQRAALSRLIQHELVTQVAKQKAVTVSGGQVDNVIDRITQQLGGPAQLQQAAAKAGIGKADLRQTLADLALRDALGDKLTANSQVSEATLRRAYAQGAAQYDQAHSAHILVASAARAQQLLRQVQADPKKFAALAAKYSTDPGSKGKGGDLGFQPRGALAKPFEDAIFNNKPGSYVIAHTQFGYHVIHVIQRRTTTFAQAAPELRRSALGKARQDAVTKTLTDASSALHITVNPRFGRWDPKTLGVVAATPNPSSDTSRPSSGGSAPASP